MTQNSSTAAHDTRASAVADKPDSQARSVFAKVRGTPLVSYGPPFLAAIAGLFIGLLVGHSAGDVPIANQPASPSMSECVANTINLFDQKSAASADMLRDARDHCYSVIRSHELFGDTAIRKLNFFQQYRANGVLMWMVVAVTVSGVVLAGLQIWASYLLAVAHKTSMRGAEGHIVLKSNQLILKSSVTGLFILLISFGFFLIFVFYVYKFETLAERGNSALPPMPALPMGGLGPPPPEKSKP